MRNKYRIVEDGYLGYCVEIKKWWFPFWVEILGRRVVDANTHPTIKEAEEYIEKHKRKGWVVKTNL